MKQIDFLVCVRCFTFNHAPYIKDAMDGFCIQQTSFPFICVIVDDASIDGEPNIIRTYMGQHFNIDDKNVVRNVETDDYVMTFAQHKVNENCFFAVYYLKYNHYSIKKDKFPYFAEYHDNAKYAALCEGDDYWIDSLKLQKQVDILEKDDTIGMVYTKAWKFVQANQKFELIFGQEVHDFDEELIENRIPTLSVCFRRNLYVQYQVNIEKMMVNLSLGDYPIWLYIMTLSKSSFINDVCCVYRVLPESASHSSNTEKMIKFYEDIYYIRNYFINQYPKLLKNKNNVLRTINDDYEWSKYRVKIKKGNVTLSKLEYKRLILKHKIIYLCNYCLKYFGINI